MYTGASNNHYMQAAPERDMTLRGQIPPGGEVSGEHWKVRTLCPSSIRDDMTFMESGPLIIASASLAQQHMVIFTSLSQQAPIKARNEKSYGAGNTQNISTITYYTFKNFKHVNPLVNLGRVSGIGGRGKSLQNSCICCYRHV